MIFKEPDVKIHLSYVLVCELLCFQINKQKAFENVIVEHKVDLEVIVIRCDPVLPTNKRETVAQLKYEVLQFLD